MAESQKVTALEKLIEGDDFRSAIVFVRTRNRATGVGAQLIGRGHPAVVMQGDMSQPQRERALQGFRDGKFEVLVATDIAARGLDIAGVSHVINFDVPNTPDAYTHRIGRTGRSEQAGAAFTFVTPNEVGEVQAIEKRLGGPIERRELEGVVPLQNALPVLDLEAGKAADIPADMIAGGAPPAPAPPAEPAASPAPAPPAAEAVQEQVSEAAEEPQRKDDTPPGIPPGMIAG